MRYERLRTIGWLLFVLSALFFTASSIKSGDMLALAGSLLFLIACIVFLLPLPKR